MRTETIQYLLGPILAAEQHTSPKTRSRGSIADRDHTNHPETFVPDHCSRWPQKSKKRPKAKFFSQVLQKPSHHIHTWLFKKIGYYNSMGLCPFMTHHHCLLFAPAKHGSMQSCNSPTVQSSNPRYQDFVFFECVLLEWCTPSASLNQNLRVAYADNLYKKR